MTHRDRFSEAEWAEIALAPMLASFAVTAADPSGLVGVMKEGSATAWSLRAARDEPGTLAGEIAAAYGTSEGRHAAQAAMREIVTGRRPAEATEAAVARLRAIAGIVDAKAPSEAVAFKSWIAETAAMVAEAGTEGGFLGFGGTKVSEAERKTLADIDTALGLPAA